MHSVNYIPAADGQQVLKYKHGTTEDIVREVYACYTDTVPQTAAAAEYLRGGSDYESAVNVAKFVDDYIRYKIDPEGVQWIKTPARLFHDHKGDCKSYSIFINSCLANLGITHLFRFVSYNSDGEYTHVYPVAIIDNVEFPLDVVALQVRSYKLGTELNYKKKKDMYGTTKISRLSGLGDVAATTPVYTSRYAQSGKVNENYLLSLIDLLQARANVEKDEQRLQSLYNKMDFYEACIAVVNAVLANDQEDQAILFESACNYLAEIGEKGWFNNSFTSMEERRAKLDSNVDSIIKSLERGGGLNMGLDTPQKYPDFVAWWKNKIVGQNYAVAGIGAVSDETARSIIKAIGPGIMYTTQSEKLGTAKAALKQRRHDKLVAYINSKHPNLSPETIRNYVRAGVVDTFGKDPEQVIAILQQGGDYRVAGIGANPFGVPDYTTEGIIESSMKDYASEFANKAAQAANATLRNSADSAGSSNGRDWADYMTMTADALKVVGDTVTGIMKEVNTLTGADTLKQFQADRTLAGLVPNTGDWFSSSWIKYAGYAALAVGAYMILKPKRKGRRR